MTSYMRVTKRNGIMEVVKFDKITARFENLMDEDGRLNNYTYTIDPISISQQVCSRLNDKITTCELDDIAADLCMSLAIKHPDYMRLAGLILVSNHQKSTNDDFYQVVRDLFLNKDVHKKPAPLVNDEFYTYVSDNALELDNLVDYSRDYGHGYFSMKTLLRAYLLKVDGKVLERPQHMWLRVSICIHLPKIGTDAVIDKITIFERIKETYNILSQGFFTHATPTLFNAGTNSQQLSSCFLMGTEDSVEGIYKTISDTALISKWAGGVGIHISNIRANGSYIRKTSGNSMGILPMLKVYGHTARYINQGGKRQGSFAMYLEPWHGDIFQFLDAKKNHGSEEERVRDLFYGLWIPDLFMKRVKEGGKWSLMCPDISPGLVDVYGDEFDSLYEKYESEGRYIRSIDAQELWSAIIDAQIETGMPYMLYKDACNRKSNQKNLGTIKSSNLCTEIIEYSNKDEYSVCNLASINLTKFLTKSRPAWLYPGGDRWGMIDPNPLVKVYITSGCVWCKLLKALLNEYNVKYTEVNVDRDIDGKLDFNGLGMPMELMGVKTVPQLVSGDELVGGYNDVLNSLRPVYNFKKLIETVKIVTRNLDNIIDINFYPVDETRVSNMKNRPIGIGVQGLADVFMAMKLPFDSQDARQLNYTIFEHMYYGALEMSVKLGKERGSYDTFEGSPLSQKELQFDLWNKSLNFKHESLVDSISKSVWDDLREEASKGVRNSLLMAPMPTASTSQILGNNECFEPYTSNMYTRRTSAGEFPIINKWLVKDLVDMELWTDDIRDKILYYKGSVQNITEIPTFLRDIYKTSWEIKQRVLIDMALDRGRFICQSQSLNLFFENPTYSLLTSAHFYGWGKGIKTGSYYIRSKPSTGAQQVTLDANTINKIKRESYEESICENCSA